MVYFPAAPACIPPANFYGDPRSGGAVTVRGLDVHRDPLHIPTVLRLSQKQHKARTKASQGRCLENHCSATLMEMEFHLRFINLT